MALINCLECKREVSDMAEACPHCGAPIAGHVPTNAASETPIKAKRKRKAEFIGVGSLVQLAGLIMPFILGPIGIVFLVILLIVGSRMSLKWTCGNCGNRIQDKNVTVCPSCKAILESDAGLFG